MSHFLSFLRDILKEPALLLGIVSLIGLVSLRNISGNFRTYIRVYNAWNRSWSYCI